MSDPRDCPGCKNSTLRPAKDGIRSCSHCGHTSKECAPVAAPKEKTNLNPKKAK